MNFKPRNYLVRAHKQKARRKYEHGLSFTGMGQVGKMCKNQAKVEFVEDTPLIFQGRRDAQHNLQQRGEIPTHSREDEIINLWFTYDGAKFFDSGT